MSLGQYARFLMVGAFVGVVSVACRELSGYLLGADTRENYMLSVALAYTLGIGLSFWMNHRFTFIAEGRSVNWRAFARFTAIAVVGLISTWLLSLTLRYGAHLDALIGRLAKPAAFATATLLSSVLTYPLNSRFVFGSDPRSVSPARPVDCET